MSVCSFLRIGENKKQEKVRDELEQQDKGKRRSSRAVEQIERRE